MDLENPIDKLLSACIRRVILDYFWSLRPCTVRQNANKGKTMLRLLDIVGLTGPLQFKDTHHHYMIIAGMKWRY